MDVYVAISVRIQALFQTEFKLSFGIRFKYW